MSRACSVLTRNTAWFTYTVFLNHWKLNTLNVSYSQDNVWLSCFSVRSQTIADINEASRGPRPLMHSFSVEECILSAHDGVNLKCPQHGDIDVSSVAPDTVFLDISRDYLVQPESVKRGKLIGRGAFGFVFKSAVKFMVLVHNFTRPLYT